MRVQGTHQIRSLVQMVKPKERGSSFLTTVTGNPRGPRTLPSSSTSTTDQRRSGSMGRQSARHCRCRCATRSEDSWATQSQRDETLRRETGPRTPHRTLYTATARSTALIQPVLTFITAHALRLSRLSARLTPSLWSGSVCPPCPRPAGRSRPPSLRLPGGRAPGNPPAPLGRARRGRSW